jgi:hypothetical protein
MTTQISSRWTPFYRFGLPMLTIAGIGFGAYTSWLHPERQSLPPGIPPQYGWLVVVATGALVIAIILIFLGGLKDVVLDGDELVISDTRNEIRVPLTSVEKISGRSLSDPPRYTITFTDETEFGRRVRFITRRRWGLMRRFTDPDEIVELRGAWDAARTSRHGR